MACYAPYNTEPVIGVIKIHICVTVKKPAIAAPHVLQQEMPARSLAKLSNLALLLSFLVAPTHSVIES